ncbi:uncharacterized protein LOC122060884 [Macadamia integrifolia]|uniref:uncharacterized protein LOC122060884 n=1 Tax=Macadamia integrifolia TaxID=60698 RepID=UPI001C52F550|nr:uncharacterized protein LOC122060884 [Macadamia integrifolia]
MRIRKYAQKYQLCCIPSQIPSPNNLCPRESPSTIVCELNCAPWDVIFFTTEEGMGDPIGGEIADAAQSILSLNGSNGIDNCNLSPPITDSILGKESKNEVEEMNSSELRKERMSLTCCSKTDGKGWKCKKEAKQGHSLCEHHLEQLKSYYIRNKSSTPSSSVSGRGKRSYSTNSKMPSSDYYYYTGFGPLWGKGRGEAKSKQDIELDSSDSSTTPSLLSTHNEDNSDVNKNVGNKKKKRDRKLVMT